MKITSISVTYEIRLNLGDFQGATLGQTMWAQPEEDEDPDIVELLLWEKCKTSIRREAKKIIDKNEYQQMKIQQYKTFRGKKLEEEEETQEDF
jgi:hypothetical protein